MDTGEQPMKNMFRKFALRAGAVALCSAALCAVPMMAQGGGGRMTPEQQLDALNKAVVLTPDQMPQVKTILDADAKKIADIRNSGEDMSTARPKILAIRTEQQTKIKAILTDDQKVKYDAYLASLPQGRGPGGGGPGGGGPGGAGAPPPPVPAR
jgi:Spy/CpxP family protein refolding chaperone